MRKLKLFFRRVQKKNSLIILNAVDLNKYPYRGTLTVVAEEMETTRQNIAQRYYRLDPIVTEKVTAEIKRRENIMKKSSHQMVGA